MNLGLSIKLFAHFTTGRISTLSVNPGKGVGNRVKHSAALFRK